MNLSETAAAAAMLPVPEFVEFFMFHIIFHPRLLDFKSTNKEWCLYIVLIINVSSAKAEIGMGVGIAIDILAFAD